MTSAPDDTHRGSAAPAITALGAPLLFPLLFPELEQEEQSRDEQKADHHQKDVRTANPPSTARLACSGSSLRHVPRQRSISPSRGPVRHRLPAARSQLDLYHGSSG